MAIEEVVGRRAISRQLLLFQLSHCRYAVVLSLVKKSHLTFSIKSFHTHSNKSHRTGRNHMVSFSQRTQYGTARGSGSKSGLRPQ